MVTALITSTKLIKATSSTAITWISDIGGYTIPVLIWPFKPTQPGRPFVVSATAGEETASSE